MIGLYISVTQLGQYGILGVLVVLLALGKATGGCDTPLCLLSFGRQ